MECDPFSNEHPLELIVWEDHYTMTGWRDRGERIREIGGRVVSVRTIGWRIWEDKDHVCLMAQQCSNDDTDLCQVVMKRAIIDRWEIAIR